MLVYFPENKEKVIIDFINNYDETIDVKLSRYDLKTIQKCKAIEGRKYKPETKAWNIPKSGKEDLLKFLKDNENLYEILS